MYDLYFLRHGRSLADDENKCEGRYDSPLTDVGINQAGETAIYFKKKEIIFDEIISSSLIRARKTAEIINELYNVPLSIEPLLMEKDNGVLAGMEKDTVEAKYPLPDFFSPFRYPPENTGENSIMLHSRAGLALNSIINKNPGRYLIVSHGGILNAVIRNILGINVPVNNSGVSFAFGDNGFVHVQYNEAIHHWTVCSMK